MKYVEVRAGQVLIPFDESNDHLTMSKVYEMYMDCVSLLVARYPNRVPIIIDALREHAVEVFDECDGNGQGAVTFPKGHPFNPFLDFRYDKKLNSIFVSATQSVVKYP